MLFGNVAVVEILTYSSISVNRFPAARRFTADYLTRYHHGIYYLEHKQMFTGFKILVFVRQCSRWYMLSFFGGKIYRGTLLKFLSKSCQGKRCANFFQFSRQKS